MGAKKRESRKTAAAGATAVAQAPARRAPIGVYAAIAVAALAVVFWVYGPSMAGPFLFDDNFALPNGDAPLNTWIHGVRPLLMVTYWLNARFSGTDTYSFHVVNVILHCLAGALLFLIVRRLLEWSGMEDGRSNWFAGFAAAVFLLHPVQTEAVAYLAGRSEALSVMLFFAAYAVFLYRPRPAAGWGTAAAVLTLFGASLLSKEHTIVLPALLLLTDYWWNPGFSFAGIRGNWKLYLPMAAGAGAGLVFFLPILLNATSAGFHLKDVTWYQYFFTECRALFVYPQLLLMPVNQSADWNFPMSKTIFDRGAIAGLAVLLALAVIAWRYRRRFPLASFGFFAYLLLMAPTSSIVPIRDAVAERRLYLSMLGLLLIGVDFAARLKLERKMLAAAGALIVLIFALAAHARAQVWSSELALWQTTVAASPANYRAHFQLASAYYNAGKCGEAVGEFARAAQLQTPNYDLLLDWGLAYDCLNQPENALAKLRQAASLEQTAHVYSQIGMVYGKQSQWAEAMDALSTAEKLDPGFATTYVYKGLVHLSTNRADAAVADYQRALALDPKYEQAKEGLAQAQARMLVGRP